MCRYIELQDQMRSGSMCFTGKELTQLSTRLLLLIKIAVKSWIRDCLTDLLAQILHPACVLDLNCRRIYMCIWNKMRWCIYLPAIQLPPRRTGSRTAFASFSTEIQPNQRNNQQKLGLPNGIKMGNQIKHGKLAYLHRGQRQRCTCGRGRPIVTEFGVDASSHDPGTPFRFEGRGQRGSVSHSRLDRVPVWEGS